MGIPTTLILHLSPTCLHHLFSTHTKFFQNPNFSSKSHCLSSSNFNWSSSFIAFRSRRFQFEDEFGRRKKRRNWWSDDDDDDNDDDDDDDDDDLEFELWDQSPIPVKWLFKIFRTFGWMIPVIVISTLQGNESKSLIMAVVLPLGQTVLSLVMDKMLGGPNSSPEFRPSSKSRSRRRSRSRRERNPFAGTANRGNRGAREARSRPRSTNGYQSWQTTNNPSSKEGRRNNSKFGGWDELDQQVASDSSFTEAQTQKVDDLEIE